MMRGFLSVLLVLVTAFGFYGISDQSKAAAHTTEIGWVFNANCTTTVYAEHWHDPTLQGGIIVDSTDTFNFTGSTSVEPLFDGSVEWEPTGGTWQYVTIPLTPGPHTLWVTIIGAWDTPLIPNPAVVPVVAPPCTPPPVSGPSGSVSHWAAEGDAVDSADSNYGVLTNGVGFASGISGLAFSFDGVDDHVAVPHAANLDFGTGDFSVEAWVKIASSAPAQSNRVVDKLDVNHGWALDVQWNGVASCSAGGPGGLGYGAISGTTNVKDDVFHHIACVRENDVWKLFVDGVSEGQVTGVTADVSVPVDLFIGARRRPLTLSPPVIPDPPPGALYFQGVIDEVKIYDRALTTNYLLEQDGGSWEVTPVSTIADVSTFYGYQSGAGASTILTDQPLSETAVVMLHEDGAGILSLVIINDARNGDSSGHVELVLTGVDPDAAWLVQDDPTDATDSYVDADEDGDAFAIWGWGGCCTDGGAIGDLGDAISIEASFSAPSFFVGLSFWDGATASHITLDLSKPFTINSVIGIDTTAPSITAPADVNAKATGEGTEVALGTPTVSDIDDPSPVVTNDAPATFPVGTTVVTWTATDESGNSASDTQTVIINGSLGLLEGAAEALSHHLEESKHFEHAVKHLNKALKEENWIDEIHADAKKGKKIFHESAATVHELEKILKEDANGKNVISGDARMWIESALADVECAIVVLTEIHMEESGGLDAFDPEKQDKVDRENLKAAAEFEDAVAHVDDGKLDKGIREFEKAWHHAVKAEEHALKELGPGGKKGKK